MTQQPVIATQLLNQLEKIVGKSHLLTDDQQTRNTVRVDALVKAKCWPWSVQEPCWNNGRYYRL